MATYARSQEVPPAVRESLSGYSDYLTKLLFARGITTHEEAHAFLNPSYEEHLHDPFLLHDMDKAVMRILRAIEHKEHIVIYSDYDCDGIPGAVVLHDFFKSINYEHFSNYIPHRHFEGFGLNLDAIEKLHKEEAQLLITIDCGTSDAEAIEEANKHGIDVIVTDHHEAPETLPNAYALVNPKVGDTYPFAGLCGSGVVFKLIQALIIKNEETKHFTHTPGWEKWWLDMVAVATIADMVPLRGENRALAHYGLRVLRKSRRPGLQQLLRKQRASMQHLTEDDIGFTIGPRINAASRMDTPEDAFHLLSTQNEEEAGMFVDHLEHLNNERRGIVATMTKEAHKRLHELSEVPSLIVMGNPDWRPSLVGLVANKLAEEFMRPAFLWGRDGNGVFKGSCRSEGRTSVITLMNAVPHLFREHGGHHFSGGFGVHDEHIHTFGNELLIAHEEMGEKAVFAQEIMVDDELLLESVTTTLLREQALLAPFGEGNPKPLYLFKDVVPTKVEQFGKTKEHLKLSFDTRGLAREAIAFFAHPNQYARAPQEGERISLYAHIEQSFFMGRLQTRLRIVDIV